MKILFISDIHGKADDLRVIRKEMLKQNIDKLVVLGDLYYQGVFYDQLSIDEVKQFLIDYQNKIICMRGNCDSNYDVKETKVPIYFDLKLINVDGLNIYLTHGDKYNIDNYSNIDSILIYGHKHYPFIKKHDNIYFINPGSIFYPRNNSKASYMVYSDRVFTIYSIDGDIIDLLKV